MENLDFIHFYHSRKHLVLDILESHSNPISLKDLKNEYKKKNESDLPFADVNDEAIHEWLIKIDSIETTTINKENYYFISKPKLEAKPLVTSTATKDGKRKTSSPLMSQTVKRSRSAPGDDELQTPMKPRQARSVRFKDQIDGCRKTRSKSENQRLVGAPNLFGSLLVGDDFLLGVAMYKMNYSANKKSGRLQTGFCVSGMSIRDAIYKVKEIEDDRHKTAIIYVGSIDIATGRELIEMMQDMTLLMKACAERNLKPILCTLAAIPNYVYGNRKETLKGFNTFITNNPYGVPSIDINKCFKKDTAQDEFDPIYYLDTPRYVSGMNKMLVLWSKIGRERVYDMFMKNLGMALVADGNTIHDFI